MYLNRVRNYGDGPRKVTTNHLHLFGAVVKAFPLADHDWQQAIRWGLHFCEGEFAVMLGTWGTLGTWGKREMWRTWEIRGTRETWGTKGTLGTWGRGRCGRRTGRWGRGRCGGRGGRGRCGGRGGRGRCGDVGDERDAGDALLRDDVGVRPITLYIFFKHFGDLWTRFTLCCGANIWGLGNDGWGNGRGNRVGDRVEDGVGEGYWVGSERDMKGGERGRDKRYLSIRTEQRGHRIDPSQVFLQLSDQILLIFSYVVSFGVLNFEILVLIYY